MREHNFKKYRIVVIILSLICICLSISNVLAQHNQDRYINILCLGIDKEEPMNTPDADTGSVGQSDAIFVVSIDKEENHIRVISIPRDTMVTLEMYDVVQNHMGQCEGQLTLQYAYGDGEEFSCELTKKQVENILGISIDAYVAVNFTALREIADLLDGVPVYMDEDYTYIKPEFIEGETVFLDVEQVHDFCRARILSEDGSAYRRLHRLQVFMTSALDKCKDIISDNPLWVAKAWNNIQGYIVTDLDLASVTKIVQGVINSEIEVYTLDGYQDSSKMYEEFYLDTESVERLMNELFS